MYVCFIYVSYMHMQNNIYKHPDTIHYPLSGLSVVHKASYTARRLLKKICNGVPWCGTIFVRYCYGFPCLFFCEPVPSLGPHCIHSFPDADAVTMGYPHDSRCRQLLQPKLAGMQLVLWLIVLPALWHL